jgi:hypothetical protein
MPETLDVPADVATLAEAGRPLIPRTDAFPAALATLVAVEVAVAVALLVPADEPVPVRKRAPTAETVEVPPVVALEDAVEAPPAAAIPSPIAVPVETEDAVATAVAAA